MIPILLVVRKTSMVFQPQIRTKIMYEVWASFWHESLFLQYDRIKGQEVDFARINAGVTSMPRVGLNPYALGMRLLSYIEEMSNKGKYDWEFERVLDASQRRKYDKKTKTGRDFIFKIRENFSDFMFINTFVDQDFINRHKLFVAGKKLDKQRMVWQYYVKSRKLKAYRKMLLDTLYHPPHITIDNGKDLDEALYLVHHFEKKPLVKDFIGNTMMGIEYLWGAPVKLETSEAVPVASPQQAPAGAGTPVIPQDDLQVAHIKWQRVVYTMENRKLSKKVLE